MLSLTIKSGQKVFIGENWLRVGQVKGNKVQLDFGFPRDVTILRQALVEDSDTRQDERPNKLELIRRECEQIVSDTEGSVLFSHAGQRLTAANILSIIDGEARE